MRLFHLFSAALLAVMPLTASAQLKVDAGDDVSLECESEEGTEYTLNGSVPEGDSIAFEWSTDPVVALKDADTLTPTGVFAVGDTSVTLAAENLDTAETGDDEMKVTVQDTEPPIVRVRAHPFVLWPPNHKMHEVEVKLHVRDRCSGDDDFEIELLSVESNEPDNGKGDGNTKDDIQDADLGEDDREVLLRAERSGNGDGRVYTLTYRVTDADGNETDAEARVYVPHDYADVKALLEAIGGDRDEMEDICTHPDDAAEAFVEAVPPIADYPSRKSCKRACKVWKKGCKGIVEGSWKCVKSEHKSITKLALDECRLLDNDSERKRCRRALNREAEETKDDLRDSRDDGVGTCRSISNRCVNACEDLHDEEGYRFDYEGVGED